MNNSIKRHFPGCCSNGDEPDIIATFSTTEELLQIPWVNHWTADGHFSHFATSGNCLMAILRNGKEWWVIGFIDLPQHVSLPLWKAPRANPMPPEGFLGPKAYLDTPEPKEPLKGAEIL